MRRTLFEKYGGFANVSRVVLSFTEPAFEESMELLRETLEDFDFEDYDIDQVISDMESYKLDVITD